MKTEQCLLDAAHDKCNNDHKMHEDAEKALTAGTAYSGCINPPDLEHDCSLSLIHCSIGEPACWMQVMCFDPCVCGTWKDKMCATLARSTDACSFAAFSSHTAASTNTAPATDNTNSPVKSAQSYQVSVNSPQYAVGTASATKAVTGSQAVSSVKGLTSVTGSQSVTSSKAVTASKATTATKATTVTKSTKLFIQERATDASSKSNAESGVESALQGKC